MRKRNIVGNNIRKFRIKAGITQEELALMSGLSQGYINQLESGKRNYTQKSLELVANAMSISLIEFFREETNEQITIVAEESANYHKKKSYKKVFVPLLDDLPEHVVDHYLALLKLERELLRKKEKRGNIQH